MEVDKEQETATVIDVRDPVDIDIRKEKTEKYLKAEGTTCADVGGKNPKWFQWQQEHWELLFQQIPGTGSECALRNTAET